MTPFARQFDCAQHDPEHFEREYRRGQEILRELTVDDGYFDDDLPTHEAFETRQPGLIIRRNRELF